MNAAPILFRALRIADANSPFDGRVMDVLVRNGRIERMAEDLDNSEGLEEMHLSAVSPGWVDAWNHGGRPKEEHRQSQEDWQQEALDAGLCLVQISPSLNQPCHDVSGWEGMKAHYGKGPVRVVPMGSLSRDLAGKELSDLLSLEKAGAMGFSDGSERVLAMDRLAVALEYLSVCKKAVWTYPEGPDWSKQVNEFRIHLELGLKGKAPWEENLAAKAQQVLAEETHGNLVWPVVSMPKPIENPSPIKAGTSALHLWANEDFLNGFDVRFKTWPPLRQKLLQDGLLEELVKGNLTFVVSNHMPWDADEKDLEFPRAAFGGPTLCGFSLAAWSALKSRLTPGAFVRLLHEGPLKAMDMAPMALQEGAEAMLTFWNPEGETKIEQAFNPWDGQVLAGEIEGIYQADAGFFPTSAKKKGISLL